MRGGNWRDWEKRSSEGDCWVTRELKTDMISPSTEEMQCLLLQFGVCLPVPGGGCSINDLAPECFSPNPEMLSLHWEEEWRGSDGIIVL